MDVFDQFIAQVEPSEDILQSCLTSINAQEPGIWEILKNKIAALQQKLSECMKSKKVAEGYLASELYCTILSLEGSEAFRFADASCTRSLISFMRFYYANPDEEAIKSSKKKKRRSSSSDSDTWNLFFSSVARFIDQLEVEEIEEVFIRIGSRLHSQLCLEILEKKVFQTQSKSKSNEIIQYMLTEIIECCRTGELLKEISSWFLNAVSLLLAGSEVDCVSDFLRKLLVFGEFSTQASRQKLSDFVMSLLNKVNQDELNLKLIEYSYHYLMLNDKAMKRVFGCEFLCHLLSSIPSGKIGNCRYIFEALSIRTRDTIPSVRCAALRGISQLASKRPTVLLEEEESLLKAGLEACTFDEKPVVRKLGVKLVSFCPSNHPQVMEACVKRCRDQSILVKKSAVEALGLFIRRYPNTSGKFFSEGILPLIHHDEEKTVSETAISIVRDIVVLNSDIKSVWSLLYEVRAENETESFKTAMKELSHREDTTPSYKAFLNDVVHEAMSSLPNENQDVKHETLWGVWLVLENSLDKLPGPKVFSNEFVCQAWESVTRLISLREDNERGGFFEAHALQRRILKVMGALSNRMNLELRIQLSNQLLQDLTNLERPPEVTSQLIQTLIFMCSNSKEERENRKMIQEWGYFLKSVCEKALAGIRNTDGTITHLEEHQKLQNALFLIGELALLGFNADKVQDRYIHFEANENVLLLVQALTSPDFLKQQHQQQRNQRFNPTSSSLRAFAFLTLGKLCMCDFALAKRCVVVFVKELSEFSSHQTDRNSCHEAVRSNSLIVLGDLCRRYTNIVESYMDQISKSFGDPSPLVRKRCLLTLAGLVQEDYVRLKPNLFYRFLASMSDRNEQVAQVAQFCLESFYLKTQTIFHTHASNMVVALCGLERSRFKFNATLGIEQEDEEELDEFIGNQTVLVGIQKEFLKPKEKREFLYQYLYSKLDEAQKLEVNNRIRRDIFGGLLDGTLGLEHFDASNEEDPSEITRVVSDAFRLLESEYSKPLSSTSNKLSSGSGELGEEGEDQQLPSSESTASSSAIQRATAKIIESLEKKNVLENIIPMMVSLYSVASRERSNLSKLVIDHLKFISTQYPEEASTALTPHKEISALIQLQTRKTSTSAQPLAEKNPNNHGPEREEKIELKKIKTPKLLRKVRTAMKN